MTLFETQLEATDRLLEVLEAMPPARVAEAAKALRSDSELAGVGAALTFGTDMRRLGLVRSLKDLALPPYDAGLVAALADSGEPLWRAISDAISAVRGAWTALGGE